MKYTKPHFEMFVRSAINKLTPEARRLLSEIRLEFQERPDYLPKIPAWGSLGEFSGSRKGQGVIGGIPTITLYQEDIEYVNRLSSQPILIKHISEILAHELCHYLGANEHESEVFKSNLLKLKKASHEKNLNSWWRWFLRILFGRHSGKKKYSHHSR